MNATDIKSIKINIYKKIINPYKSYKKLYTKLKQMLQSMHRIFLYTFVKRVKTILKWIYGLEVIKNNTSQFHFNLF